MPEIHLISTVISVSLGLFIGLVLALTGAGGSILAIPLLVISFNLTLNQAAPIALMAVALASSIDAIQGLRLGIVRYKTAFLMASFGLVFAPLGVWLAQYAPNQLLNFIFCVVLLIVAWNMWQQSTQQSDNQEKKPSPACALNPSTSKLFWTAVCTQALIVTGAIAGFLSGLLGVGGGFVLVPSLSKVTNFNNQTIIATALFTIALVSAMSIFSYTLSSDIHWSIAVPFIIGTVLGLFIFRSVNSKISTKFSQRSFAVLAILAAILILVKAFSTQ
ncbi:MAG: sulfite exporter TauE/SafE family protein [Pseudomonadota bacterium]